jgi:transcription termination factor Rho
MNERRRPHRRGRGPRPYGRTAKGETPAEQSGEPNPYRDTTEANATSDVEMDAYDRNDSGDDGPDADASPNTSPGGSSGGTNNNATADGASVVNEQPVATPGPQRPREGGRPDRDRSDGNRQDGNRAEGNRQDGNRQDGNRGDRDFGHNARRGRRNRGRGGRREPAQPPVMTVVADGEATGWFDVGRDGGYIRRAANSYLAEAGDPFVPTHVVRQMNLRRGDTVEAAIGRDQRGRITVAEVKTVNGVDPATLTRRPDFGSLTASYPERKLTLETGKPAKGGPEVTRRAIDLIAPIGYGQRALIVAPARAGKTMLLQAITEGVALNHPQATLLVLLVDERPEEVSEMITWGYGEVVASSFDMPAERHTDVAEMTLEHARRLVELGRDVVIVLDSITRLARAHNTVERGTGRTLSGGLDATAMAKPKAFFGSARSVAPNVGGGSLTIIATALVETGSRMDDVIFEEFKGTGNSEIKLDRSLSEKRIFPAFDIATSGTRREEKLYRADQLDAIYTLRRGLQQMPPQAAMEWLIKRIAATPNNDTLLAGL